MCSSNEQAPFTPPSNDVSPTGSPPLSPTTRSRLPRDSCEKEASKVFVAKKGHVSPSVSYRMEHGIYWRSPFVMLFMAIFGIFACVAHHFFYKRLRGTPAYPDEQQMYLRIGNVLAWLAQLSLTSSVWMVYNQLLWLSLAETNTVDSSKGTATAELHSDSGIAPNVTDSSSRPDKTESNTTTLRILDVATTVQSSIISLFHFWLFKNLKLAYVVAITASCLQIPSLVTPSTLVVVPSMNVTGSNPVPVPDINNPALNGSFAYDSPMEANASTNATDLKFVGARSIVSTIGAATASSGRIQDIIPPFNQTSYQEYSVSFAAPYMTCKDADNFQTQVINATVNKTMSIREGTYVEGINAFSAFIPIYGGLSDDIDSNTTTVIVNGTLMTALWVADLERPLNSSTNEIWMRFYRYKKDSSGQYIRGADGQKIPPDLHFLTCMLYNATYNVSFTWNGGVQSVVQNSIELLGPVLYPNDTISRPSNVTAHAYSSIFLVLANEIVGTMAFYKDTATNTTDYVEEPPVFSSIQTQVLDNSLTGSDDLDYFFAVNKELFTNDPPEPLSDQRLQDKAVAKNRTLDLLIEELSFNITISLLHDPLLARLVNTSCTHAKDGNQYDYMWCNLAIAYSLAIAATLVASLLGIWAFHRNGAAFDNAISTVVSVTRGRELDNLFPSCCHGVQPLPKVSLTAPLVVKVTRDGRRPGRNIVLAKDVKPVCEACNPPPRRPTIFGRRQGSSAVVALPTQPLVKESPDIEPSPPVLPLICSKT